MFSYRAKVLRVTDGDSVIFDVILADEVHDYGFRIHETRYKTLEISTRLLEINAPERYTETGKAATAYMRSLLPVGEEVRIETFKDPGDKYGRWLVKIYKGDLYINQHMIEAGHAVAYAG